MRFGLPGKWGNTVFGGGVSAGICDFYPSLDSIYNRLRINEKCVILAWFRRVVFAIGVRGWFALGLNRGMLSVRLFCGLWPSGGGRRNENRGLKRKCQAGLESEEDEV